MTRPTPTLLLCLLLAALLGWSQPVPPLPVATPGDDGPDVALITFGWTASSNAVAYRLVSGTNALVTTNTQGQIPVVLGERVAVELYALGYGFESSDNAGRTMTIHRTNWVEITAFNPRIVRCPKPCGRFVDSGVNHLRIGQRDQLPQEYFAGVADVNIIQQHRFVEVAP